MGAMYRLKAYFGMVPAEELGEYAEEPVGECFPARHGPGEERWDEQSSYEDEPRYDDGWDRRSARPAAPERPVRVSAAAPSGLGSSGLGPSAVRGALAIDPDSIRGSLRPVPAPAAVPEQREPATAALSRITTLQPRSYNEARTIGERYRDGVPVIMNLTELDEAAAKRLVDFAAGLAFALRGSIDKVTSRVFLLTPADVEVSADDARRLAERTTVAPGPDAERGLGRARLDAERGHFRQD